MSLTNGYGHIHDPHDNEPTSQAHGAESPLSDAASPVPANGNLTHPHAEDDPVMQDMDTSDADIDDEDAAGEDDDEYDNDIPQNAVGHNGKRYSLSSEGSSRSSKRKRAQSSEDDFMKANPELYGLRRSGRAKPVRQLAESSDEDDDVVHPSKKRAKTNGTRRNKSLAAFAEHASIASDSESEDDVYGGSRARVKSKKLRNPRSGTSGNGTPLAGEVRFSTRRTAKVTNYNEDEEAGDDDFAEDDEGWEYVQGPHTDQEVAVGIEAVLNHRLAQGAAADSEDHNDFEFLIKWEGLAHCHATWEDWKTLSSRRGYRRRDNYFKKTVLLDFEMTHDADTPPEAREQWLLDRETKLDELAQWLKVERVIDRRSTVNGTEYYVKWKALYYDYCTWESSALLSEIAQDAIDKYLDRTSHLPASNKKEATLATRSPATRLYTQPTYVKGGILREFQLVGMNFLAYNWSRGENVILADEMGLGKTVQTVGFCNWLYHDRGQEGPFIVAVPLSTLPAWQETFAVWAPDLNVVVYNGNDASRKIIQAHEMFVDGNPRKVKFNVLLTTYEYVNTDATLLSQVKWQFLAVDEAHRLKNRTALLYGNLLSLNAPCRLLITGTPMQNDLSELSALMDFLMPGKISLDAKLDLTDVDAGQKLAALTAAIAPFMLRRTKQKVESDLPPKTEKIVRIELSDTQLDLYKNIVSRNYAALNDEGSHKNSLLNIVMELKKCSNHALMFPNTEERILGSGDISRDEHLKAIIQNSGKMIVLDRLLTKLKKEGHRVLIFSQMVGMLNILGEYLGLRGHQFQRLDGTIPSGARKLAIDHFNAPDSQDFAFLLSTRAGGLGINLMTADTVVLFDSDWNPQADLQAMARAHRIGQKKPVSVYRFVSKDTIEEEILERARNKLMLEFITIQRGVTDNDVATKELNDKFDQAGKKYVEPTTAVDISRILKKRSQKMFESSGNQKRLEELDIDDVLANAELHNTEEAEGIAADGGEEFLRNFEYTDVKLDSVSWDSIIPKDQLDKIKAEDSERANQEYLKSVIEENAPRKRKAAEEARDQRAAKKRARALTAEAAEDSSDEEDESSGDPARPLNDKECRNLVKAFERYGSMEEMEKEVIREARLISRDVAVVKATLQQIRDQADQLLEEEKDRLKDIEQSTGRPVTKKERKTILFDFRGVKRLNAETLKERPEDLSMIRSEVKAVPNELNFRVSEASKPAAYSCPWGAREDGMLLAGIARHGYGAWAQIRDDLELGLDDKLFLEEHRVGNKTARNEAEDKKNAKSPGAVHLVRRTAYLISVLRDKTSGGADEQAKKALENHHRNNRKTTSAHARVATPQTGSASPMNRPLKNNDRVKDQKSGTARNEKLSATNGISKSTHSKDPEKSAKRRLSDERADKRRRSDERIASLSRRSPAEKLPKGVNWDADRCDILFAPLDAQLAELRGATSKRIKVKADKLAVLKKLLLRVGDFITATRARKAVSDIPVDDLWKHIAYYHWPNKQPDQVDTISKNIRQNYEKLIAQRAELQGTKDHSTPPEDPKPARPGLGGEIPASALPSFQRRQPGNTVDNSWNPYKERREERPLRDNRDVRRSRSRSPRRERMPSPAEDHHRGGRREPPRDAHRQGARNGGDNWRPRQGGDDHGRRGERDDPRRDQRGNGQPRGGGSDRWRPTGRDWDDRRDHRRSTSTGSNRSGHHEYRRRGDVDSWRPPHRP